MWRADGGDSIPRQMCRVRGKDKILQFLFITEERIVPEDTFTIDQKGTNET
jgi:hypothetical protein